MLERTSIQAMNRGLITVPCPSSFKLEGRDRPMTVQQKNCICSGSFAAGNGSS